MSGKWMFRWWLSVGMAMGACGTTFAQSPWTNLISQKNLDANPEKAYLVTENNGPWMIMACSFSGDGAEKQAQELTCELRKRYKLPAYTYQGRFDPGEAQGRGVDEYGKPRRWNYIKYKDCKDKEKARHPEITEVAVLVGDYASADDPEAKKTLQKIKYAIPQCLEIKEGKKTNQTLTGWRMIQRQVYEAIGSEKKELGPMSHAFVTTNPSLPSDFFASKSQLDPMVISMNKDAEFSLLNCPKKYTVQVATFRGGVVIKQDEIQAIQSGAKQMKGGLEEAADKAHRLAKALRMKGYEAYEFHDRYASIVTVGSFDSVGSPRADGRTEINPEVHKIMERFRAKSITLPGQATPANKLEELVGIPFDIQPIPVEAPKRPFSMAMQQQ